MDKEHIKTIGRELTAEEFDVLIREYILEGWREINDGSVSSPGTFSDFRDSFIDVVSEVVDEVWVDIYWERKRHHSSKEL